MIPKTMHIQWMNIKDQFVIENSVQNLFQSFSNKAWNRGDGIMEVDLSNHNILIADWKGWTKILSIKKIPNLNVIDIILEFEKDNRIKLSCSEETLIPFYNKFNKHTGFHGETKYLFNVKKVKNILHTADKFEFIRVRNNKYDEFQSIARIIKPEEKMTMYQILTKSGFYNAINRKSIDKTSFYLWGRSEIPEDYCHVCPVRNTPNCSSCRK